VPARFELAIPDSHTIFIRGGRRVAISPDGRQLLLLATKQGNQTAVYTRRLEDPSFVVLRGTEDLTFSGNIDPSFSPDGAWILLNTDKGIVKIPSVGGRAELVADDGRAAHWGVDNRIVFMRGNRVFIGAPDGRDARPLAAPDTARFDGVRWPHLLPDGNRVLVSLLPRAGASFANDSIMLGVIDVESGELSELGLPGGHPQYLAQGYILYARAEGLAFVAPFDLRTARVTGPPIRLLEGVWTGGGGALGLDAARNRTMVVHRAANSTGARVLLVNVLTGAESQFAMEPTSWSVPRFSPDGRQILVEQGPTLRVSPNGPIVVLDLATGATQRLTGDTEGLAGSWTQDGRRIRFVRFLAGSSEIVERAWDRSAPDRVVFSDSSRQFFELENGRAGGWSALRFQVTQSNRDIYIARTDDLSDFKPFVASEANERHPAISPDGRWMAYTSNEKGQDEVYLQPLPGPGPRIPVSVSGGNEPLWAPDGRTLYFRSPTHIVAARLAMSPLAVTAYDTIMVDRFVRSTSTRMWDVSPDGKSFLLIGADGGEATIEVIINWTGLPAMRSSPAKP
jgi:serine/threonine-protein kinase